jgi:hypothetical protein
LNRQEEANELAKLIVYSARAKVDAKHKVLTPYSRKYKKTYNATWEVSK